MSSEGELREAHGAYAILRKENGHQICLLSCSLEYPACQDVNFTSWSNRNIFFSYHCFLHKVNYAVISESP